MKNEEYNGVHPNLLGSNCTLYYFNAYTNRYVMAFLKYFGEEYNITNNNLWLCNKWDEDYITDKEFFNYIKYCLKSFVSDYTKFHGVNNDKEILRLTSEYERDIKYLFKKKLFHYDFGTSDPGLDIFVKVYSECVSDNLHNDQWLIHEFDQAIFFFTLLEMYPNYKSESKNNFYKIVFNKTLKRILIFWTQFSSNKIMGLLGPCLTYGIVPEEWYEEEMYGKLQLYRVLNDEPAINFIMHKIFKKMIDSAEYKYLKYPENHDKIYFEICKTMLYVKGNYDYDLFFTPFKSKYIDKDDIYYGIEYEIVTELRKIPNVYDMKSYIRTLNPVYKDFLYTTLKHTPLELMYMYGTTIYKSTGKNVDIYVYSFYSYLSSWLELGLQNKATLQDAIREIENNAILPGIDMPTNDNLRMVKSVCKALTLTLLSEETMAEGFLNTIEKLYRPKKRIEDYFAYGDETTNTPNVPKYYYTVRLGKIVDMYNGVTSHNNTNERDHILIRNGIAPSWRQEWYLEFNFIKELLIETCLKILVNQFKLDLFYTLQEFLKTEVNENYELDLNKCKIETVDYILDKNSESPTNDEYYTLL